MPEGHKKRTPLSLRMSQVAREARKKAGLTQEDVAGRIGLVTEVYGRFERGDMLPSVPTLVRLCSVLHLDANEVLGLSSKQTLTWIEESLPERQEPQGVRRLVRALRQLSPRQLRAVSLMVSTLLMGDGTER